MYMYLHVFKLYNHVLFRGKDTRHIYMKTVVYLSFPTLL